jgi:hypothetical protein
MAKRKSTPKRPAPRSGRSSGGRVSGTVHVSPKLTLFGGSLLNLSFGGGSRAGRGRGKGGLLKRLATSAAKTFGELNGKDVTRGKITGREKGQAFDEFRAERPDLFAGQGDADLVDDDQGDDEAQTIDHDEGLANYRARTGGAPGGCACGGISRHAPDCEVWR